MLKTVHVKLEGGEGTIKVRLHPIYIYYLYLSSVMYSCSLLRMPFIIIIVLDISDKDKFDLGNENIPPPPQATPEPESTLDGFSEVE